MDYLRTMAPAHAFFSTAYYDDPAAPTMGAKGWAGADLIFDLDADHMLRPPFPPYPVMLARTKEETLKLIDLLTDETRLRAARPPGGLFWWEGIPYPCEGPLRAAVLERRAAGG